VTDGIAISIGLDQPRAADGLFLPCDSLPLFALPQLSAQDQDLELSSCILLARFQQALPRTCQLQRDRWPTKLFPIPLPMGETASLTLRAARALTLAVAVGCHFLARMAKA
jgi:hypothetical protein